MPSVPTPKASDADKGGRGELLHFVKCGSPRGAMIPTPTAGDSKNTRNSTAKRNKIPPTGIHAGDTLCDYVTIWPTPTASTGRRSRQSLVAQHFSAPGLEQAVEQAVELADGKLPRELTSEEEMNASCKAYWPTPRSFMHKDSVTNRGKSNLGEVVGGKLNPTWVEWLMGWPLGWTQSGPSATASFLVSRTRTRSPESIAFAPSETAKSLSAPPPPGGCSEVREP
jgi:hypothetical protein